MGSSASRADRRFEAGLLRAIRLVDLVFRMVLIGSVLACGLYLLFASPVPDEPPEPLVLAPSSANGQHLVDVRYVLDDQRPDLVRALILTFDRPPTSAAVAVSTGDPATATSTLSTPCVVQELEARCEFLTPIPLKRLGRLAVTTAPRES